MKMEPKLWSDTVYGGQCLQLQFIVIRMVTNIQKFETIGLKLFSLDKLLLHQIDEDYFW